VVAKSLLDWTFGLLEAMRRARESSGVALYALMVTDVLSKETDLPVAGDVTGVAGTFGTQAPRPPCRATGVMSGRRRWRPS
jgi:hypothetical protein